MNNDRQSSYRDSQGIFGRFSVHNGRGFIQSGAPAGAHWPGLDTVAAGVGHFVFAVAVCSVLKLLLDFLELNVDGIWALVAHGDVDSHSISSQLGAERVEHAAKLLPKSLVKVEVDERVVDMGAFGEEGGENKALRSHVPAIFVENEEEGHDSVWCPGNHKTQADAEKHLEEESNRLKKITTLLTFTSTRGVSSHKAFFRKTKAM